MYFHYQLPDTGLFRGSWLPDTILDRSEDDEIFEGGGIRLKPVEPMRTWNLKFEGEVVKVDARSEVRIPALNFQTFEVEIIMLNQMLKQY